MKILMTGFEPFGGETMNPAYEALKLLPENIAGAKIIRLQVPTAFSRCAPAVEEALLACRPDAVICVGQAGGRTCVTVERVAINLADAGLPDNLGAQPVDEPIRADGPAAYFSTLPVRAIVKNIREHGIPCQLSCSAGTYVCNCLMYELLHRSALFYPHIRAGFLHVPFAQEQAVDKPGGTPSASLATIARALELAAEAVVKAPRDDLQEKKGLIC
ncbi:MAG: pyroglutamyl-peptidase I [Provencibacterium sp.]|jgi:pyroglutamyl-peptidase|nr:pyroglutamyl-peptidase I [Provencibacterium sp.]